MGIVEILLIGLIALLALIVLGGGGLFLGLKKNPEKTTQILLKSKRLRKVAERQATKQLAKNPQMIEEMAAQINHPGAKKMAAELESMSPEEREQLLSNLSSQLPQDLSSLPDLQNLGGPPKPLTPAEKRAQELKKQKARAKRRAAKQNRKKR